MLFSSWLRNWKCSAPAARSRLAPTFRRRFLPRVEILEDRTLLSIYMVNSLTDTGTGSGLAGDLRYCITQATSGRDTITFKQGLTGTIQLQNPLPTLNASVDIQGPGADTLTVIPTYTPGTNPQADVFSVGSAANVQISGLTLSTGSNYQGLVGPIGNAGTVTVSACTIANFINNFINNGRLFNEGTMTLSGCTLTKAPIVSVEESGSAATLTIGNSTLSDNSSIDNAGGTATVIYCTLSGDTASAIYNANSSSSTGSMTINNSSIAHNSDIGRKPTVNVGTGSGPTTVVPAGNSMGGGIYMSGGTLSINSSTIADNEAIGGSSGGFGDGYAGNGYGGGLYIAGGAVSINNSTLADNQALGGAGNGGGIYNAAGPAALQMYDTVLADNSATTAGADLDGRVTSLGHNLIGNWDGGSGFAASDLVNVNLQLSPLQNNGGPTETMALLPGSPAINAGDNTNAPPYDQRGPGFPRIVGGTIDIGAFEVQAATTNQLSSFSISGFPASITAGSAGTFTVAALNADGSTDSSYTGTVHFIGSDSQAGLPADYTFTSADAGVHSFSAILKTAGTQSITATDTATGISKSQTGIVVNPAAASSFLVRGYPSPSTAGVAGSFSVTAIDPFGNTASGYSGTVHFTSSDARAVPPANYTFQASDYGVRSFLATLKTAAMQSITVKDTSAGFGGSDTGITVKPAAASRFAIAAPASVVAGARFSLTVTVLDGYGNLVTGYTDTVHFSSSDGTATLPANYAFQASDGGKHTFTALVLRKEGEHTITVTDKANSSVHGSAVVDVLSMTRLRLIMFLWEGWVYADPFAEVVRPLSFNRS